MMIVGNGEVYDDSYADELYDMIVNNGEVYDVSYVDNIYEQQRLEVEWDTIWEQRYLTTPVALGREIGKWERKFE